MRMNSVPQPKNTYRSTSVKKEVPAPPEPKKFIFKGKKMPDFSKPFVPSTSRGKSRGNTPTKKGPAKFSTPVKKRSAVPSKRRSSPIGLRLRSQSSTPNKKRYRLSPRNNFSKSITSAKSKRFTLARTSMSSMDVENPRNTRQNQCRIFQDLSSPKRLPRVRVHRRNLYLP